LSFLDYSKLLVWSAGRSSPFREAGSSPVTSSYSSSL